MSEALVWIAVVGVLAALGAVQYLRLARRKRWPWWVVVVDMLSWKQPRAWRRLKRRLSRKGGHG